MTTVPVKLLSDFHARRDMGRSGNHVSIGREGRWGTVGGATLTQTRLWKGQPAVEPKAKRQCEEQYAGARHRQA